MSTLGITFYSIGVGLLAGFVGNVLAGWFNSISDPVSNDSKKRWIGIFIAFGVILVLLGMVFGVS